MGGKRRARVGEGSLRQREDGTWELRFRHGGETISVYGKTPAAARKNRNEKLAKLGEAPTQARRRVQGLTLRAWAKEWLATGQSPRKSGTPWSEKTRERYRTHIRDLDQRWGGAALARLDGQELTDWIRQRYPNAPSQQFHCAVTIKACVAAAIRARKLGKHEDPFAGVPRIQQPKRQLKAGRRNKAWTQDEVRALLAAAAEVDAKAKFVQVRPALVIMLGSGLGPGELLGLEPRHVDWRAKTIAVEQHREGPLKTEARPRTVRVSDQVLEALATLRDATSTRYLFEGGYDALKDAGQVAVNTKTVPDAPVPPSTRREPKCEGKFTGGGSAPYGFEVAGGSLVEVAAEQAVVDRARNLRAEGLLLRAVAAALAAKGAFSRSGRVFQPAQISRMVSG